MAAFTKGQVSTAYIDMDNAHRALLNNNEKKTYDHISFKHILGRDNLKVDGRRGDLDATSNSIKVEDIREMSMNGWETSCFKRPENLTFQDFLPNSILKRKKMRKMLKEKMN